jgi:Holliday junction DNA helicase RuvA
MLAWLRGHVVDVSEPGKMVLDVQGVGYDVETSLQTYFNVLPQIESPVSLHIHTVVREDAFLLYGFLEKQERTLFRALIKVNGIGPKSAMAMLSSITPQEFIQCIESENSALLTKLPGIGKKTAERLIVEMRDKIGNLVDATEPGAKATLPSNARSEQEAISALEALGYKPQEALKVIKKIEIGEKTAEQLIREALQLLASSSR